MLKQSKLSHCCSIKFTFVKILTDLLSKLVHDGLKIVTVIHESDKSHDSYKLHDILYLYTVLQFTLTWYMTLSTCIQDIIVKGSFCDFMLHIILCLAMFHAHMCFSQILYCNIISCTPPCL